MEKLLSTHSKSQYNCVFIANNLFLIVEENVIEDQSGLVSLMQVLLHNVDAHNVNVTGCVCYLT
jgi:hypothetical protein